jgi:hypothetical protein
VLRSIFVRLGSTVNTILGRARKPGGTTLRLSTRLIAVVGTTVFWITILVFAAIAARVARLDAFSGGLDRLVAYLPTLIAGSLIVLAGYLVSALARDVVATTLSSVGAAQHRIIGFAAQSAVFLTAAVIGLDQIGVDVTFLIILVAVLVGGISLSIALAFGLGARDLVGNLIASHQTKRMIERGESARIGESEGRVLEITPTCVVLITDRGRLLVPAKLFQQQATLILSDEDSDQ